jgi:transposase
MMVIGIDAHKRSHTAVTVDELGRQGFTKTVGTTTQGHLELLKWAAGYDEQRLWAIEDCRHLTRRLERDLIAAGELVGVPPKLMAHVRDSARSYGKLTRSMPWRWLGPRCGNRICRLRVWTVLSAKSGC